MVLEMLLSIKGGITFAIVILCLLLFRKYSHTTGKFPPGPISFPVIGSILSLGSDGDIVGKFREFRNQYGDLFTFTFGTQTAVVVSGYENLKEIFLKMGDVTSDRPGTFLFKDVAGGQGLVSCSGQFWKIQRTFALTTLREFGFGKRNVESRIMEEVSEFLQEIEKKNGQPFDVDCLIKTCVSNVICSMAFGQRFEHNNPKFLKLVQMLDDNMRRMGPALAIFPFLRYIPGDPFKFKIVLKNLDALRAFFMEFVHEHQETFDKNNIRDYIDAFLVEMNIHKDEPDNTFTAIQLRRSIGDLFAAGTETTATTIKWAILYLLHYPDCQSKMRQELDDVIGTSRPPSLNDRASLPYCEAFITEVQRCCNILPLGVQHCASADFQFKDFVIPKGTILLTNLDSVLSDPLIFEKPERFNPERFIDDEGKYSGYEKVVAFSIGRRVCLGESLARSELFLFLTSMVQRFRFLPEDKDNLPALSGRLGITYMPHSYRFIAQHRQ